MSCYLTRWITQHCIISMVAENQKMAREHLLWNYPSLSCKIMLWLTKKKIAQRKIYLTLKCVYCWKSSMQIIPGNVWVIYFCSWFWCCVSVSNIYFLLPWKKVGNFVTRGKNVIFVNGKVGNLSQGKIVRNFVTRENNLKFCHKGKQSEILSLEKIVWNYFTMENTL